MIQKEKFHNLDFIKIENMCSMNGKVRRTKRQATDWEKTFLKDAFHNGLLFKIYKEFLKLNNKKEQPNEKVGQNLNRLFIKEDTQMANKHVEIYSESYVIRELQIKTTMRCYCTPVRTVKVQDADSLHMRARMWNQSKSCFISGGNAKWYCHFGRPFGGFLQN